MHYAGLIFGESGTMPSEGSVMGVPSVYVNPLRLGYLEEQERDYGLVSCFRPEQFQAAVERGVDILRDYDRDHWRAQGQRLRSEKIDVTDMLFRIATERPYWQGSKRSAVYWTGASDGSHRDPDPFFIVGSGRSGTTLLHSMLATHSAIAVAPETQLMSKGLRVAKARGAISADRVLDPDGFVEALTTSRYLQPLLPFLRAARIELNAPLGDVLHRAFMAFARAQGKDRWGEKTPHHLWYWREIDRLFPTCRFIILSRDGRDVVSSLTRTPWASDSLLLNAYRWKVECQQAERLASALGSRVVRVGYEGLVTAPERELTGLCDFVGVPYEPAMATEFRTADVLHEHEAGWKAQNRERLSDRSIGRHRRDVSAKGVAQLNTLLEPELRDLGYQVATPTAGAAARAALTAEAAARFYASFGMRHLQRSFWPETPDENYPPCQ
jgi:hypothetical protein